MRKLAQFSTILIIKNDRKTVQRHGVGVREDIRNNIFSRQLGKKLYELKDHLGNERVTFSDIKTVYKEQLPKNLRMKKMQIMLKILF